MGIALIPTEDNYVDWGLAGIREYFARLGFRIRTHSVAQVMERQIPVDRVFRVGNKVVGLQFKRPIREGPPGDITYCRISTQQSSPASGSSTVFLTSQTTRSKK